MNDNQNDQAEAMHRRQVDAVMAAVAKLLPRLAGMNFTPEAIFEGACKGGAVAIMQGHKLTAPEVGDLFADLAEAFRENPPLDRGKLHVVQ